MDFVDRRKKGRRRFSFSRRLALRVAVFAFSRPRLWRLRWTVGCGGGREVHFLEVPRRGRGGTRDQEEEGGGWTKRGGVGGVGPEAAGSQRAEEETTQKSGL